MSEAPTVTIAYPKSGDTIEKGKIAVGVVSQDDTGLHAFRLIVDDKVVDQTDTDDRLWPDLPLEWNARPYKPGRYTLTVVVEDVDGNTASDSVSVNLVK